MTVDFWVNVSTLPTGSGVNYILDHGENNMKFALRATGHPDGSGLFFELKQPGKNDVDLTFELFENLTTDTWNHIAITRKERIFFSLSFLSFRLRLAEEKFLTPFNTSLTCIFLS